MKMYCYVNAGLTINLNGQSFCSSISAPLRPLYCCGIVSKWHFVVAKLFCNHDFLVVEL